MTDKWSPNSWRAKKAKHIPNYQNEEELNDVLFKKSIGASIKLNTSFI